MSTTEKKFLNYGNNLTPLYALILFSVIAMMFFVPLLSSDISAHRSGCHRWHSCPSDSGSYGCGNLGYECKYSSSPSNSSSTTTGIEKESRGTNILSDPNRPSDATSNAIGEAMLEANKLIAAASNSALNATNATGSAMNETRSVPNIIPNNVSDINTN
jgi:hypothetical protein